MFRRGYKIEIEALTTLRSERAIIYPCSVINRRVRMKTMLEKQTPVTYIYIIYFPLLCLKISTQAAREAPKPNITFMQVHTSQTIIRDPFFVPVTHKKKSG